MRRLLFVVSFVLLTPFIGFAQEVTVLQPGELCEEKGGSIIYEGIPYLQMLEISFRAEIEEYMFLCLLPPQPLGPEINHISSSENQNRYSVIFLSEEFAAMSREKLYGLMAYAIALYLVDNSQKGDGTLSASLERECAADERASRLVKRRYISAMFDGQVEVMRRALEKARRSNDRNAMLLEAMIERLEQRRKRLRLVMSH